MVIQAFPRFWQSFLRDSTNKTDRFHFLADRVAEMTTGNPVIMTKGENAITTISDTSVNLEEVDPCTHKEADTRLFVHARNAATERYDPSCVLLPQQVLRKCRLHLAQGSTGDGSLNQRKRVGCSSSMPSPVVMLYHLSMAKGKKTAWQTRKVCKEASVIFTKLSQCPSKIGESELQIREKCVVLMYDRLSSVASVNEARLALFGRKQRSYILIPPALKEHAKRAAYEAGHIFEPGNSPPARASVSVRVGLVQRRWLVPLLP